MQAPRYTSLFPDPSPVVSSRIIDVFRHAREDYRGTYVEQADRIYLQEFLPAFTCYFCDANNKGAEIRPELVFFAVRKTKVMKFATNLPVSRFEKKRCGPRTQPQHGK